MLAEGKLEPESVLTPNQGTGGAFPAGVDRGTLFVDEGVKDLKGRSVRGGAVTFVAQAVKVVLYMGSTMLLARLLTPKDFGLISMVTAVTGFVEMFKDAGLSMATIQRERITQEQISTLFWLNTALSGGLMLLVIVLSPVFVLFYHEPRLLWVSIAIATTFLLSGLTVQHQALLRRNLRFRDLAIIEVTSLAVGAATATGMALLGFKYWSLVGMTVTSALTNAIAVWVVVPWRPGRPQRGCGVGPMIGFGGNIVASRFLYSFVGSAPTVLIGSRWGAGPVGLYQKAYSLLMFAIDQIHGPVAAVALSPLSRVQGDIERFQRYFLAGYSIIISLALPVVVVSAVLSEEIIRLLLGAQWLGAVGIFRWLAVGAIFVVLLNPLGIVLQATGRAGKQVIISVIDSALVIAAYLIALRSGPQAVAIAFVVVRALVCLPITYAMLKGTSIGIGALLRTALTPLTASLFAAIVGVSVKFWLHGAMNELALAAVAFCLMLSTYALSLLAVFGKWQFYKDILSELLPRDYFFFLGKRIAKEAI